MKSERMQRSTGQLHCQVTNEFESPPIKLFILYAPGIVILITDEAI